MKRSTVYLCVTGRASNKYGKVFVAEERYYVPDDFFSTLEEGKELSEVDGRVCASETNS